MYNKENLAGLMKTDSLAPEAITAFWPVTRRLLLRRPKTRFLLLAVVLSSRLEPLNTVVMNGT